MLTKNDIKLLENEYSPEIKSAIGYISNNLSVGLSISAIAKEISFAPSTLTRRFRKETGMSIGEYIDNLIMFRAERALISTDSSILEISEAFGFCDQFYFSRRFKEKYGASPREYRKKTNI
jgi:AraC-like DNA-binding protein